MDIEQSTKVRLRFYCTSSYKQILFTGIVLNIVEVKVENFVSDIFN